jgi:PST family polysaccharide transporter
VSYLRAVGDAKATVHASAIQVVVLLVSAPLAVRWWGVTGIAWSMTLGLGCAAAWMLYRTLKPRTA